MLTLFITVWLFVILMCIMVFVIFLLSRRWLRLSEGMTRVLLSRVALRTDLGLINSGTATQVPPPPTSSMETNIPVVSSVPLPDSVQINSPASSYTNYGLNSPSLKSYSFSLSRMPLDDLMSSSSCIDQDNVSLSLESLVDRSKEMRNSSFNSNVPLQVKTITTSYAKHHPHPEDDLFYHPTALVDPHAVSLYWAPPVQRHGQRETVLSLPFLPTITEV